MKRELLKCKPYLFLLSAQTVSNLGDWLNILAPGIDWLEIACLTACRSGAMLCLTVPSIVFGSFAGTLADRFDRKTLMILSDH